jgi:hypothetical protein
MIRNIKTIAKSHESIVEIVKAIVVLPLGTKIIIENTFIYPKSNRTLLTFRDIHTNDYNIKTTN